MKNTSSDYRIKSNHFTIHDGLFADCGVLQPTRIIDYTRYDSAKRGICQSSLDRGLPGVLIYGRIARKQAS